MALSPSLSLFVFIFLFCLVGQNMFLSLCWLLIFEDDIYWMSHNPKHTITCGSNADIPLLLMGRTLWQRVIYSNWNLNHFFPQARHPVWWWININRSAERGFCLSKPLTRYLRKTLFVKWGICTLLHFVCIPIPCVLYFFYHLQFIFCQHGVFQNWIKGINAEKFFSNTFLNFVLVV